MPQFKKAAFAAAICLAALHPAWATEDADKPQLRKAISEPALPDQAKSDQIKSDQIKSDQIKSDHAKPDEVKPDRAVPAQAETEKAAPENATPPNAVTEKPAPAKAAPFNPAFNDAARFLAGMPMPATSPIARFTAGPGWQQHAHAFDAAWRQLELRQISKIRVWSDQNLKRPGRTLFYMFSGPDFIYADAFFPKAATYVMSGLEPVGRLPEISERSLHALPALRASLSTSLNYSFFITKDMRHRLGDGAHLSGTLPILFVSIARSGKTIREATLINLDNDGAVHPAGQSATLQTTPGVRIVFAGKDGEAQTLYYFRTDVSDSGVKNSGFLRFCETLGRGDGLLKSASYLMHSGNFTKVRDFVLDRSDAIVQDDSGIPVLAFKPDQWQLSPFGKYVGPISIFPGRYQPKLKDLFQKNVQPIAFGVGYRWRPHESHVLLAVKKRVETEAR